MNTERINLVDLKNLTIALLLYLPYLFIVKSQLQYTKENRAKNRAEIC